MKDTPKPGNRRPYDAAFRAEALRLAAQSRSTQAESLGSRFKTEELERREWTILTITTTTDYTSASATRRRISLINNFFKLLP